MPRQRTHGLSRRGVLQAALLAGAPRDAAANASSQLSKAAAQYQDSPRGGLSCVGCTLFRRPRSCQVVAGDIDPNGWCRFFDLPD